MKRKAKQEVTIETIEETIAEDIRQKFVGWEDEEINHYNFEFKTEEGTLVLIKGKVYRRDEFEQELYISELIEVGDDGEEVRTHIDVNRIENAFNNYGL